MLFVQSSGKAKSGASVKKWSDVNVFEVPIQTWQRGCELRQASIWQNTIFNSSRLSSVPPPILRKCGFVDFTPASHKPSKCAEYGGMKFHLHLVSATKFLIFCVFTSSRSLQSSLQAPTTKVVPLSKKTLTEGRVEQ